MPLPDYEELYAIWVKTVIGAWGGQYAAKHPNPRLWRRPMTRLQVLLLAVLALASCGLLWMACGLVTGR